MTQASVCEYCNAQLFEGQSALYDESSEFHFCSETCFDEWYYASQERLKDEYWDANLSECDL